MENVSGDCGFSTSKIMHAVKNPRGQPSFGIRRFALIDLRLLGSLELGLELITQGEQPPFRNLPYVVHVEDEGLEDDDIGSIPAILGSHR